MALTTAPYYSLLTTHYSLLSTDYSLPTTDYSPARLAPTPRQAHASTAVNTGGTGGAMEKGGPG